MHPDREMLLRDVSASLERSGKVALIGDNGSGKSTLMKIISDPDLAYCGEISVEGELYVVPQHFGQYDFVTVGEALGVDKKLLALTNIVNGSSDVENYDILNDDWDIENRVAEALAEWGLSYISTERMMNSLSGGEKTRVFLSGIRIYNPSVILMDEPTNHLDMGYRERVYDLITGSTAAILVVSHDRTLLNQVNTIWELSEKGIKVYGGNYEEYVQFKELEITALHNRLDESRKELKKAEKVMHDTMERKNRKDARGKKRMEGKGIPRIMINTIRSNAQKSGSKLKDVHDNKISMIGDKIRDIRSEMPQKGDLKLNIKDSEVIEGKLLIDVNEVNYRYEGVENKLFESPISFKIFSGERILVSGDSGSGKSSLLKMLTGAMEPTEGVIKRLFTDILYLDQEYSVLDNSLSVVEQAEAFNLENMPEHQVKILLNRYLFTKDTWDKKVHSLSGGEKIRLLFCCLTVRSLSPDIFILDEPTNNLDISSLEVVVSALRSYKGTLILVSHDRYLINELNIERTIYP